MRIRHGCLLAVVASAIACGGSDDSSSPTRTALTLTEVDWNPSKVDVGAVQAVADDGTSVSVFGSKGVQTFVNGSLVSGDETIVDWRSAAILPSDDGLATWVVGVDANGHLERIRTENDPEDVTARFGLVADKVQGAVGSAGRAGFLLDSGVALSDGANVTHFTWPASSIATSKGIVALAGDGAVRIFDHGKETDVEVAGATMVAYDNSGSLVVASAHALYRVQGTATERVFDAGARTIHQLAGAGANVWFSLDADLGLLQGGKLAIGTAGVLTPDARLVASPTSDIWVVAGGKLQRFGGQAAAGDEAVWKANVEPVYIAVCSNCHGPPGSGKSSSNVDLSTYAAWNQRRAMVYQRVVTKAGTSESMPPPTSQYSLTDAQRSAIRDWSKP